MRRPAWARDGRPFTLFKIRTMAHDCEKASGARWSTPGDPRITRVGAFLRKTHLDELPQLWNVLRGDMSLVGPRPERPEFTPLLEQVVPHYRDRLAVRPGVTGLAQVQLPADTDLDSVRRKLAYDLYYIRHLNGWLDLRLDRLHGASTWSAYPSTCSPGGSSCPTRTRLSTLPGPNGGAGGRPGTGARVNSSTDGSRAWREPLPMTDSGRPNLLYVVHRTPYPPDKGDRIRTFHLLRHLSRAPPSTWPAWRTSRSREETTAALGRYCERVAVVPLGRSRWLRAALALAGGRTITEGAFESAALAATVSRLGEDNALHGLHRLGLERGALPPAAGTARRAGRGRSDGRR